MLDTKSKSPINQNDANVAFCGIFHFLKEEDYTCPQCKSLWGLPQACSIQWEDQGVEWIDFELHCECDLADNEPYPCLRFNGLRIEYFTRTRTDENTVVENTVKHIIIETDDPDFEEKIWYMIGERIDIPLNNYWHWSKKWHDHAKALKTKLDALICPECDGTLEIIGNNTNADWFCLDCDYDTLRPIKKENKHVRHKRT